MATAVIIGVGAVTAAILGRSIMRHGLFVGRGAAEEFFKGGFRAKMDRKEAVQILGLKLVFYTLTTRDFKLTHASCFKGTAPSYVFSSRTPTGKLCLQTTRIEAAHLTLPVRSTRRKTCWTKWRRKDKTYCASSPPFGFLQLFTNH